MLSARHPADDGPPDQEGSVPEGQVTFDSRADRRAEYDQRRCGTAQDHRRQHERDGPQPFGHEFAIVYLICDIKTGLQRCHTSRGGPQRHDHADDQRSDRSPRLAGGVLDGLGEDPRMLRAAGPCPGQ